MYMGTAGYRDDEAPLDAPGEQSLVDVQAAPRFVEHAVSRPRH